MAENIQCPECDHPNNHKVIEAYYYKNTGFENDGRWSLQCTQCKGYFIVSRINGRTRVQR